MDYSYTMKYNDDGGKITIDLPPRVCQELEAGRLLVNLTLGPSSVGTSWVNFITQDDNPAETMDLNDAERKIAKRRHFNGVETDPLYLSSDEEQTSLEMSKNMAPPILTKEQFRENERRANKTLDKVVSDRWKQPAKRSMTYPEAERVVKEKNLLRHRKQGVLNFHPVGSLVKADFSRVESEDFLARAVYVASKIGSDKAVARINTNEQLWVGSSTTLHEWWMDASYRQRALLLSDAKHLDISKVDVTRLSEIECPFREADLG